jgi:nitrogen regulatory protein PII
MKKSKTIIKPFKLDEGARGATGRPVASGLTVTEKLQRVQQTKGHTEKTYRSAEYTVDFLRNYQSRS